MPFVAVLEPEAPETTRAGGGRLTPEGHEGWSTVWGLGGGDKTLNTRRIQYYDITVPVICDRYRCRYSGVDIKYSSITDNHSLKLSKVYSSLFADFHKLLGHLLR